MPQWPQSQDPGSVSGNVFYKYNDFVGNKPDAGTLVKLYDADGEAKTPKYETTSDVQGNFKIENVEPDEYLAFIQSKSTTAKDIELFDQLQANSKEIKHVFGVDVDAMSADIKEVKSLDDLADVKYAEAMSHLDASGDKYVAEYGSILKKREEKMKVLIAKLPDDFKKNIGLSDGVSSKLELKKIKVEEAKNFQSNTDFGLTYK